MSFQEESSKVPILSPISLIVPAAGARTIFFPSEFFGIAVSLIITNLDAAGIATYQIGGQSQPLLTLAADAFRTFDNAKISLITINASAGGATQLQAQVQLIG